MSTFSALLGIASAVAIVAWLLYLVFAQVTVRRLEKNPDVREQLGFEAISGWRVINVAEALVLPQGFFKLASKTALAGMYANSVLIRANTSRLDKTLAHLFFWSFFGSGFAVLALVVLNLLGLMA